MLLVTVPELGSYVVIAAVVVVADIVFVPHIHLRYLP